MLRFSRSIAPLVLSALFATSGFAADPQTEAAQTQPPAKGSGPGGGMMGGKMDQRMRMMQDEMLKMHELSHRILEATDPKERERLKQEHLALMKAHRQKMMERHKMMRQHRQMMQQNKPAKPPAAKTE